MNKYCLFVFILIIYLNYDEKTTVYTSGFFFTELKFFSYN